MSVVVCFGCGCGWGSLVRVLTVYGRYTNTVLECESERGYAVFGFRPLQTQTLEPASQPGGREGERVSSPLPRWEWQELRRSKVIYVPIAVYYEYTFYDEESYRTCRIPAAMKGHTRYLIPAVE